MTQVTNSSTLSTFVDKIKGQVTGDIDLLTPFIQVVESRGLRLYAEQEEAILALFSGQNVILNTPTGSGKSLVAQALHFEALCRSRQSYYTSPIKALVNEKFLDLCREFGSENVGMITGDATVNARAPIICCTAEILANLALREGSKALVNDVVIDERVVGQETAVQAVADAVRRARAGVADPNRPTGSFLFLGPTGVGKTELAKALADFLFDDERSMTRIDMSEYSEKHSVARLVGAPPGYVGYEEGGQLTEAVRRRPYTVVLLDEVEKAHPEVFDILLQVLDDGRLTDGQGRTVDFRNAILILTSNLGSMFLVDPTLDDEAKRDAVMAVVRSSFKPEFLNRLDDVVMFNPLGTEQLTYIVDLQLASLQKRLVDRRLTLEVSEAAKQWLVLGGFDPIYGARPLRRLVQTAVGDSLAKGILAGEVHDGDTVVVDLDSESDTLTVTPRR